MKVKKKVSEEFQPITLSITFDNVREFNAFSYLMGKDRTVPASIYKFDTPMSEVLSDVMGKVYDEMGGRI